MMKKIFLFTALVLSVLLLAACGTAAPVLAATPVESGTAAPAEPQSAEATLWQAQFTGLADTALRARLQNGAAQGDSLYYISSGVLADETPTGVTPEWPEQYWVYGPILVKVSPDGQTEVIPYVPERPEAVPGENSGVLFEQLCADADGSLWVVENRYRIEKESERSREEKALVHLRPDGSVLGRLPLQPLAALEEAAQEGEGSYAFTVPGLAGDGKGNICVAVHEWYAGNSGYRQSNRVCVLDAATGEIKNVLALDGEIAAFERLGDGQLVVVSYRGATPVVALVDAERDELTEVATLGDFISGTAAGAGDTLYYSAGNSLYRLHVNTAEEEKLFDWTACDVAHTDDDSICVLPDGRIVTTSGKETADGMQNEVIVLSPVAAGDSQERKVLRMAVVNLYPFTSEMVSRFNRSQTEYRIEVTDYSAYNDYSSMNPADWNAGLTRLQTELIAGNVPDLIDISLLPVSRLGEKGLLEDLKPYIEADAELSMEQLNSHVLQAFEENGKLFQTVSNYYVMTTLGLSDVVGEQPGWTMEAFNAAMQRLQAENRDATVFDVYTTRDDALTFLLYLQLEDYVDWSTGTCRFDSEAFQQFLSFVRSFPTSFDWGADVTPMELDSDLRILNYEQLMKQCNLSTFEDVQRNTAAFGDRSVTFVGYPTQEGVGSMFAQIGNAMAISSSCADKEAAWAFVRQFFLPVYQEQLSGNVFPTNLAVYEKMKAEAMTTSYQRNPDGSYALDEDGKRIEADRGSAMVGGMSVKLRTVTPEEVALVEELIAATTHVLSTDDSLEDILLTNAAPYFADQRSVEDTVKQIQSRAVIYINEQR